MRKVHEDVEIELSNRKEVGQRSSTWSCQNFIYVEVISEVNYDMIATC